MKTKNYVYNLKLVWNISNQLRTEIYKLPVIVIVISLTLAHGHEELWHCLVFEMQNLYK